MNNVIRPDFVKDEHLTFLDDLRDSGVTNMWGSSVHLKKEFPNLTEQEARSITGYWMGTFSCRHPKA